MLREDRVLCNLAAGAEQVVRQDWVKGICERRRGVFWSLLCLYKVF